MRSFPTARRPIPLQRALLLLASILVLAGGCGSETATPASTTPATPRIKQEPLTDAAWSAELVAAPELKALADAVGVPRRAAGVIEDKAGHRLIWAEFAAAVDAPRDQITSIFRSCTKAGVCTAGKADYTDTGATLTDASGKALDTLTIGAPVLQKTFVNHDLKNPNTILAPLSRSYHIDAEVLKAQLGAVAFGKRRLVVLNAYGPAVGVSMQAVATAGKKHGLFDTVTVVDHARRSDLLALVPVLTPQDVVVWLGAGVFEQKSDGKHAVGLTLSRGVLGDEMIHYKDIGDLLAAPALGGPGLVVLAGTGTVNPAGADAPLALLLQDGPVRPVVGFSGVISAGDAISASATLLDQLGAGKTLADALAAAGHGMATTLGEPSRKVWKLPGPSSAFWAGKPPKTALLTVPVKVDPKCVPALATCTYDDYKANQGKQLDPTTLKAGAASFDCAPTFEGPWFQCTGSNPAIGQQFELKGLMLGTEANSHVWIYIQGSASSQYQDMTVVGNATISGVDKGGGATTISLGGGKSPSPAAASTYVDGDGHCCIASEPLIQDGISQPGKLVLKY
jgi:hypothetical protein